MENKLYTVKIKNTDSNSRAEFRRQFHLIWDKCDIQYYQNKRQEDHVKNELLTAGIVTNKYLDLTPPKIDLNLLIEEGGYTPEESKRLVLEEMTIVAKERANKTPIPKLESTNTINKQNKNNISNSKILNTPLLIQIIGENKHLIKMKSKFLDDLMVLLARGETDAYSVINNFRYRKLVYFINTKYKEYQTHRYLWDSLGNTVSDSYTTLSGVVVTKENLTSLIYNRYLANPNYIPQVNTFWETLIKKIRDDKLQVNLILLDPNYKELRDYIENVNKSIPKEKTNIEKYRAALISKVTETYKNDTSKNGIAKKRIEGRIARNKKLLKRLKDFSVPLTEIIKEYQELFLFLDVIDVDITEFSDEKVYPDLSWTFTEFTLSSWYPNLSSKTIYFSGPTTKVILNKDGTVKSYILDEVVVTAQIIRLEAKTTIWGGIRHYVVKPKHIFQFLTRNVGEVLSFREAVAYTKDNRLLRQGGFNVVINNLKFTIHGFLSKDLDIKIDLRKEQIRPLARRRTKNGPYAYYIYFSDEEGNTDKNYIYTADYTAFEMIVKRMGLVLGSKFLNTLSDIYIEGIRAAKNDSHKLSRYYASLPSSTYKNDSGLRVNKFSQKELEEDLDAILKQWFILDAGFSGANEEVALINILMAMDPQEMYNYLYKNTYILYKIFDTVDGSEYKRFVQYLSRVVDAFDETDLNRTIWFSNNSYSERDIHVKTSDWNGQNKIYFDNYSQNTTFYIKHGKKEALNLEGYYFHPLELVSFKTVVNGIETEALTVPAFYLYNKVDNQNLWDWFEIALDVVSVASIYGSARVILTTALKQAGKKLTKRQLAKQALAFANIAKETSSFAIRNEDLNQWMLDNGHEKLLKTWRILDTTGDLIYLGSSLRSLKNINLKGLEGNVKRGFDKGVVQNYQKLKQYMYEADEVVQQLLREGKEIPENLKNHLLKLEKDLNGFLDQVIGANGPEFQLAFAEIGSSSQKGRRINFESRSPVSQKGAAKIAKEAALKRKFNIDHLTIKQQKYFEALDKLEIKDKKLLDQLIKHGKDTPYVTIKPEKVAENIKKGGIYENGQWLIPSQKDIALKKLQGGKLGLTPEQVKEVKKYFETVINPSIPFDEVIKKVENGFTFNITTRSFNKPTDVIKASVKTQKVDRSQLPLTTQKKQEMTGANRMNQIKKKNELEKAFLEKNNLNKKEFSGMSKTDKKSIKITKEGKELSKALGKLVGISEKLGDITVIGWIKANFGDGFKLLKIKTPGGKQGEFDFVVVKPNQDLIIIDAKGAGSGKGTRITKQGKVVQQGTKEYTIDIIEVMKSTGQRDLIQSAVKIEKAWKNGKLNYLFINQGVKKGGDLKDYIKIEKASI